MRPGKDELARIEAAIREAEARTSGEIVVVLARASASYRSAALAVTLLLALLVPWPLALATGWTTDAILLAQLGMALALLATTQSTAVRIRLVPSGIRRRRAREAAERAFAGCGLAATGGRIGILLFVSLTERHAEVIGDRSVAALLPDETWRGLVGELVDRAAETGITTAIVESVGAIGAILAEYLPPERQPSDELPNRVVLL